MILCIDKNKYKIILVEFIQEQKKIKNKTTFIKIRVVSFIYYSLIDAPQHSHLSVLYFIFDLQYSQYFIFGIITISGCSGSAIIYFLSYFFIKLYHKSLFISIFTKINFY